MRAEIHDGQERSAPRKGRKQKIAPTQQIQLATHGRSIQLGHLRLPQRGALGVPPLRLYPRIAD
jgi:hypothetical protein